MGKLMKQAFKKFIMLILTLIKETSNIGIALIKNLIVPLFKMFLSMINGIINMLNDMVKNLTDNMKETVESILPDEEDTPNNNEEKEKKEQAAEQRQELP